MERLYNEKTRKSKHLSEEERIEIAVALGRGDSIGQIARDLNRAKSSIWQEIKLGTHNGQYKASRAHNKSIENRRMSHKHCKWANTPLLHQIERYLQLKWSPEIIAVKLKQEHQIQFSHSSIYNVIRQHRPNWNKYLLYKGTHKYRRRGKRKIPIPERQDITLREAAANNRERFGDIEADTVISVRGGKSCLAVLVDRKTRYYWIQKIKNKSSYEMERAMIQMLKDLPIKTITYDNGTENARHMYVNKKLGCKSYFCHAYRSADKGSIENRNKILRQFLPKKTNFDLITDAEIAKIQLAINSRPLKVLDWKTPLQALADELLFV